MSDHQRYAVSDPSAPRTWDPSDKCRDEIMNLVLGILLEHGEVSQKLLNIALADQLPGVSFGTVRAYVSASLLHFAQAGWAESIERDGERSPIWRVID